MKEAFNAVYAPEAGSAPTRETMFNWISNNTPYCSRSWSKKKMRQWYVDNCPFWNEDWWWETKHPHDRPASKRDLPYIFWSVPDVCPRLEAQEAYTLAITHAGKTCEQLALKLEEQKAHTRATEQALMQLTTATSNTIAGLRQSERLLGLSQNLAEKFLSEDKGADIDDNAGAGSVAGKRPKH